MTDAESGSADHGAGAEQLPDNGDSVNIESEGLRSRSPRPACSDYAALDGWGTALKMFGTVPFELARAYSLSMLPLFILMGAVAARANMAREMFDAANGVFSGIRGALANATIGSCALFGAICVSSIATAATFSGVAVPEMRRHGYEPEFAAGAVASAGTLGVLIPPSGLLAIYAVDAEQSLPKLYAPAFVPGFVLAALYVLVVFAVAWARPGWVPRLMSHPNIARVLDAGATEAGRPYFVMELVRGTPITRYCDDHDLSPPERLELFMAICQAVQHAHRKGIMHRDLNPSNILVTIHDPGALGVPKIIDFGIAKATQGRLTDQTLYTAFDEGITDMARDRGAANGSCVRFLA